MILRILPGVLSSVVILKDISVGGRGDGNPDPVPRQEGVGGIIQPQLVALDLAWGEELRLGKALAVPGPEHALG